MPSSGTASTRSPPASGSMLRRSEQALVIGAIGAVVLAAVAGVLTAPTRDLEDPRLSTYLAGPHGAKGLAQTLRRLGMTVEQRRHPYFDLAGDSAQPPRREAVLLAFLDIDPPTAGELAAVRDYVTHGGRIFVAGVTGIETCFGYRSRRLRRGAQADSSPVVSGGWRLPRAGRVLGRIPAETLAPAAAERPQGDRCASTSRRWRPGSREPAVWTRRWRSRCRGCGGDSVAPARYRSKGSAPGSRRSSWGCPRPPGVMRCGSCSARSTNPAVPSVRSRPPKRWRVCGRRDRKSVG